MIETHYETIRLDSNPPKAIIQLRINCTACKKSNQEMLECKMFGTIHTGCQDCGEEASLRYDPNALEEFTQACLRVSPIPPQQAARVKEIIDEFVEEVIEATTP